MKKLFLGLGALLMALLTVQCERPGNPISEGVLDFSVDTVAFDSIFTTFLTPSERLIVRNSQGRALNVSRIWLESGEESEFDMIVDGLESSDVTDIIIGREDSIHIFINLKSVLKDDFAEEYVAFQVGDEIQRVLIRGKVIDAYFLRARVRQEGQFLSLDTTSFFFRNDTVLTPEKPIIMDGPIFIPEGVTVTILPGTEIFFTPYKFGVQDSNGVPVFALYSILIVDGTLIAEGEKDFPIVFQGSRFDSLYQENPAQWRGINFRPNSKDNILRHCQVKNALLGLQVDSSSVNQNPKLTVQYSELRNMGAHGIVGVGFAPGIDDNSPPNILMENSIVNTCKERTLLILGGGKYDFYNCTFANFSISRFSRRTPQMLVGNWWTFDGATANIYPSYIRLTNSIVWGSEDDEVVLDTIEGAPFDVFLMENCATRLSEDNAPSVAPHLLNSFVNQDPLFNDFFFRDYRLTASSPMINAGLDFPAGSSGYDDDYRASMDSLRYDGFDLGAWEYFPLDE